jgi:4'-phosphopantetheinyl transferase
VTAVDVWSADLDASPGLDPRSLPAAERERAARLRRPRDRARWIAARGALRRVLGHYLGQDPARIELGLGDHGKPALADPLAALRFNLSHSGGIALVAVTPDCEVGIDVEERREGRDFARLAEIGLDAASQDAVRGAAPEHRAVAFYAAWVRREAVVKCVGTGLGMPLPETPPVSVCDLEVGTGHAAALAIAGARPSNVRRHTLPPA